MNKNDTAFVIYAGNIESNAHNPVRVHDLVRVAAVYPDGSADVEVLDSMFEASLGRTGKVPLSGLIRINAYPKVRVRHRIRQSNQE